MAEEVQLPGGVANAGAVVRVGDEVIRPANEHSPTIHALLRHVRAAGFDGVPEPLAFEPADRERLTFIPGDVPVPPYPAWAQTDAALASIAALLWRFHDATVGFVSRPGSTWSTEMADPAGRTDVVGHNDVCLENVVFREGAAVALLDFDFAAPARRVYDLASFARMCVPLESPAYLPRNGWTPNDPFLRLRLVADAYGLARDDRSELLESVADQIARGGEFVRRRVEAGEEAFIRMWNDTGGMARFDSRREWFRDVRPRFADALS